jgi:N-methylhydantoinase A
VSYLGVDIGRTFTDLSLMGEDGTIISAKALTALGELEKGALDAIELVPDDREVNVHSLLKQPEAFGRDTATNALIERSGAPTGLNPHGFDQTLSARRSRTPRTHPAGCGILLESEVCRKDDESLITVQAHAINRG